MKKILIFTISLFVFLIGGLVFFVRSEGFLNIAAGYAGNLLDQTVSIGSVHLEKGNRIIVRNLTVTEKEKGDPRIILPETEVVISFGGIKKRIIDELTLINPEISFPLEWKKHEKPALDDLSLPVDFEKMSIREGTIIIKSGNKTDVEINKIHLNLQRQAEEKVSILKASARIPGFISKVDAEATVDVRNMYVSEAHIEFSGVDAGSLYSEAGPDKSDAMVRGTADISIAILNEKDQTGGRVLWKTEVSVQDLSLHSESMDAKPRGGLFKLNSEGVFMSHNSDIEISTCEIHIGGLSPWQISGKIGKILSENPDISLVLSTGDTALHEAGKIVSGPAVTWLQSIDFRAYGTVKLEVSGSLRAPAFRADVSVKGDYLKTHKMSIEGFETNIPVDYKDNILTIQKSSVQVTEGYFYDDRKDLILGIHGLRVRMPGFEYKQGKIMPGFFQANAENAVVYREGREAFSESGIILKGMVYADLNGSTVMIKDLTLNAASIKGVSGEVTINQDKSRAIEASLSWEGIDIKQLEKKALSPFLKEKGLSIHGTGNFNTKFRMSEGKKETSHVSGSIQMSIADAGFSSADETRIGEGIQGELSGSFEIPLPFDRIDFAIETHMTGFELLSGKFYGNFKNKKLSFSGAGSYTKSLSKLIVLRSETGLTDIGKIFFSGNASGKDKPPFIDGEILITEISNSGAFNFLLRETYKERFPFLSELEISGKTSAGFRVKGSSENFTVRGNLDIKDMNIVNQEDKNSILGIQISLPVDLSYPETDGPAGYREYGFMKVQDVSWGFISLKDMKLFPVIRQNVLTLKEDMRIRLFGGDITLRDVSYNDILSPEHSLRLAMNISNISLAEAGNALGFPEFNGTLTGTIPRAVFSKRKLVTDGEVLLELFGGRVRISNLSVDNVFSPVASIKSRVEIDDINLGNLTSAFDFGHISGVISGRIQDLVIVNGQAQSFTARLETVRKKGVSQKINVEALKKISILGTGTSTSLLDKGIYRFLKEYRYDKIGFSASLNNDNLLLLGIENTGNVGYLVKGGLLPPKVDVINYTQNVSFKEMVKRLKRLGQAKQ